MTIGRTEDNDLVLTELGVSRRHVRLFTRGGRPHAEDPGNHRTLLNDQPLSEARELKAGDLLSLGPVVLRVEPLPPRELREPPPIERVETRVAPPEEGEAPDLHRLPTAPAQGGRKVVPIDRAPTAPLPVEAPAIDREPTDPGSEESDPASEASDRAAADPGAEFDSEVSEHSAPVLPPLPSSLIARLQQESEALSRPQKADAAWTPAELPAPAPRASAPRPALGEAGAAIRTSGAKSALSAASSARASGQKEALSAGSIARASGQKEALSAGSSARASGQKARPASDRLPPPRASGPQVALGVPGSPRSSGARSALSLAPEASGRARPLAEDGRPTQAGVSPARPGSRGLDRRWLLAGGAGAAVVVVLAGLWLVSAGGSSDRPSLGGEPLEAVFGAGPGVSHPEQALVSFQLDAQPEPQVVAVLHFWGESLSPGELDIRLNGTPLQHPLKAGGVEAGEVELVLSREALRADGENVVEFRRNPDSSVDAAWRISGLWVERVALPAQDHAALLEAALAFAARGREHLDRSAAGPDSLFQAWRAYRSAWLTVEPIRPAHPLYAEAHAKYQAIGASLNERCMALLAAAERSLQGRDAKGARDSLDQVARYFPSGEHRCHNLAVALLAQHGL